MMSSNRRTNYITPQGEKILRTELRQLWRIERPEWTQRLSDAAKEGDRSENAEYIYSRKKLREIDRRVHYLTKRLEAIEVVHRTPVDQTRIFFGAWVELDDSGIRQRYRLVGSDEFDHQSEYISIDSPLAKVLLGKSAGDEVRLDLDNTIKDYTVIAINYEPSTPDTAEE